MDSHNNLFSNFGEKLWDDINANVGNNSNHSSTSVFSNSEGLDILQQSLQEAQIYDGSNDNDPLDFDDFGFTFNSAANCHDNNTNSKLQSQSFSGNSNFQQNEFDVSDFFNLTSPSTKTTVSTTYSSPTTHSLQGLKSSGTAIAVSQTQKVESLFYSQPTVSQSSSKVEVMTSTQNNPTSSANTNWSFAKPVAYIHLQLPKSEPALASDHFSVAHTMINQQSNGTHYVVTKIQTAASQSYISPFTVHQMSTVQSKPVAVNNITLNKSAIQPVSTSSFSMNIVSTTTAPQMISQLKTVKNQLNQQQSNSSAVVFHQLQGEHADVDQANKLLHFLQTKAVNQSGSATILKVGNQNIDISNPAIAKALASKILQQQKLKLQKQGNAQIVSNSSAVQSCKSNVTLYNLSSFHNTNMSINQQLSSTNIPASVSSNFSTSKYSLHLENKVNSVSPSIEVGSRASPIVSYVSPVVHLNATKSTSLPINRIQIASVNIARTTAQLVSNTAHRFASPVLTMSSNAGNVSNQQSQNTLRSPVVMSAQVVPAVSTVTPSTVVQYLTPSMKVNLTSHQTNSLAKGRLQKLVVQNQPVAQPPKAIVSLNNLNLVSASPMTSTSKISTSASSPAQGTNQAKSTKILSFRVDPHLTAKQVDEVQQIISKKLPLSRVSELTNEQKQLLSAFRAQLRTMEPPIQQYYLRNPELFLQKVYQHTLTGKPFLFHLKVEQLGVKASTSLSSSVISKSTHYSSDHHPTITLSSGAQKMSTAPVPNQTPLGGSARKVYKRPLSNAPEVTIGQSPSKRPSLITEQLQRHRGLVGNPSLTPFKNARDAFRRLLPYHVFNTPEISKACFEESESLYDRISKNILEKTSKMINKYHLLCLKDAAMEVCSADAVMLERTFLQQEKAAYADMKRNIEDDPDALLTYLPPSYEESHPDVVAFLEDRINSKLQIPPFAQDSAGSDSSHFTRLFEHGASAMPNELPASGQDAGLSEGNSQQRDQAQSDLLLQEAVESILS